MLRPLILPVALAVAACLGSAPAFAAGGSTTIRTNDLDLSSPAGRAELDKRIDKVADKLCRDRISTGTRVVPNDCLVAVRAEVMSKLAQKTGQSSSAKLADKAR